MGGALILVSVAITTLLWADLRNRYVWICLLTTLGFGAVGWVDDWRKVVHRNPKGLSAGAKMTWQSVIAIAAICLLAWTARVPQQTELIVPFFKTVAIPLGIVGVVIRGYFVVVGTSNAVNLTDGLDGLAIGLMLIAAGAMTVLAYLSGNAELARYLELSRPRDAAELTIFCAAMTGSSLGFLWYNAHPAEIFMGDVGALGLGGGLGTVAVLLKQELLLLFIGGVYVVELLSVVLQVASFKLRGKRIFKMAPLHHHFEQLGWAESKVIIRFWIAGLLMALFALTTLKLR
jgi:phospho-N-acetylmuramoyl-pentapeptide-transferase